MHYMGACYIGQSGVSRTPLLRKRILAYINRFSSDFSQIARSPAGPDVLMNESVHKHTFLCLLTNFMLQWEGHLYGEKDSVLYLSFVTSMAQNILNIQNSAKANCLTEMCLTESCLKLDVDKKQDHRKLLSEIKYCWWSSFLWDRELWIPIGSSNLDPENTILLNLLSCPS